MRHGTYVCAAASRTGRSTNLSRTGIRTTNLARIDLHETVRRPIRGGRGDGALRLRLGADQAAVGDNMGVQVGLRDTEWTRAAHGDGAQPLL